LAELSIIGSARRKAADYYAPLLDSDDEILKVGAWCALLDREEVSVKQYSEVIALSSYGAIQRRAFRFFQANWEHDLAANVAAIEASSEAEAQALAMQADLDCDAAAAVEAHRRRFLATGRLDALIAMVMKEEQAAGWRPALSLAEKVLVLSPHDPMAANLVLHLLYGARQADMLEVVVNLIVANTLHPFVATLYAAAIHHLRGKPQECLMMLGRLGKMRPPRADVLMRTRPLALQLSAEATEALGDYRKAYAAYAELNKLSDGAPIDLDAYQNVILTAAARQVPPLPPDLHSNHVVMTGFPRSGTTLLENALAAHPAIESFEEIPSNASMELYLGRALLEAKNGAEEVEVYLKGRERYYDQVFRRARKPGAELFVDKLPMRSAEADFMAKMFPDKRYIFSIRHPFDVVLSCFKQHFDRNIAMEHFRSFEGAVKLYDFTMKQWFGSFGMDDPRIHYVRYDTLVTAFEPTLRDTLGFLGVRWDDAVLDFANAADSRSARTPSYQKVRQGLTLGVQSAWRNYGFLFQSEAAKPLFHWAEFFGYPTK
jgi:tetratricopeptide (TPR) repeat protein